MFRALASLRRHPQDYSSLPFDVTPARYVTADTLQYLSLDGMLEGVAGNNASGQVTRERRRKPFQLARGAMIYSNSTDTTEPGFKPATNDSFRNTLGRLGFSR